MNSSTASPRRPSSSRATRVGGRACWPSGLSATAAGSEVTFLRPALGGGRQGVGAGPAGAARGRPARHVQRRQLLLRHPADDDRAGPLLDPLDLAVPARGQIMVCLLYTSDAADDLLC